MLKFLSPSDIDKKLVKVDVRINKLRKKKIRKSYINRFYCSLKWVGNTLHIESKKTLKESETISVILTMPYDKFSQSFITKTIVKFKALLTFYSTPRLGEIISPLIGILFLLLIFFIFKRIKNKKKGESLADKIEKKLLKGANKSPLGIDLETEPKIVKKMIEIDTNFKSSEFIDKAKNTILLMQKAWNENDMSKARSFISQGLYQRFKVQLALMIEDEGKRNKTSEFEITVFQI